MTTKAEQFRLCWVQLNMTRSGEINKLHL